MSKFNKFYAAAAVAVRTSKHGYISNKESEYGPRLIQLMSEIENWPDLLTIKQYAAASKYLETRNCYEIDRALNLRKGSAYTSLFSDYHPKTNPNIGAIGRLENAYKKLKNKVV